MQIERDKAAQQLDEALKLKNIIDQISIETGSGKIIVGKFSDHKFEKNLYYYRNRKTEALRAKNF